MPDVSQAQFTMMHHAAVDPAYAASRGISQKVARDFVAADKQAGLSMAQLPKRAAKATKAHEKGKR